METRLRNIFKTANAITLTETIKKFQEIHEIERP